MEMGMERGESIAGSGNSKYVAQLLLFCSKIYMGEA